MNASILTVELLLEHDIVHARQRARQLAGLIGFDAQDQSRIATTVSEMARNAFKYARGGKIEFSLDLDAAHFVIRVSDQGSGIPDLQTILDGRYQSATGMGLGIIGARRLMDSFDVETGPSGTLITLGKDLPKRAPRPTAELLATIAVELAKQRPASPLEEIQEQNQELLRTLEELRRQKAALAHANNELEETNRGVVALYAELDERADYLQRANEIKTRFLSNMTHEFRTPLNSILNLARILIERLDGDLTSEQEKQVRFIARSAEDLSELVNDLLDLAKVEAGKILVRPSEFEVVDLFAALRGMLRPLLQSNTSVNLVIEEPEGIPTLMTDESKVSQILRNFISNAIKYTERGEVHVSARRGPDNTIVFSVRDTGIGIAAENRERIFEEFTQIESPLQQRIKGTGLGLPLSRRLAGLLGGNVGVTSTLGEGSTFFAQIPAQFRGPTESSFVPELSRQLDPQRLPVLVVEDNRETLFVYDKMLKGSGYQVLPARTLAEARQWLNTIRPVAVILDVLLESESTWNLLADLRQAPHTKAIPTLVVTMVDNEPRAQALGAHAFHTKPIERDWLIDTLSKLTGTRFQETVLIVDDDEVSRYVLRSTLADTHLRVVEAESGSAGLSSARAVKPRAIFLDLGMPDQDGFAVLHELKLQPELRDIPVIIYTAKVLSDTDREKLTGAVAVVSKASPSREAAKASIRGALSAAGLSDQGRSA
jgi:signal transduction histidine kinase/CheY-like chemotaxis protein